MTHFQPIDGGFRYQAPGGGIYPVDTAGDGEKQRIDWLNEYLADNKICPKGYEIMSRQPILKSSGLLADSYDIFYEGRCK